MPPVHSPGGVGRLNLVRVPSVRPEKEQTVEFGLDVCKLGLSFWEDSQKAAVFLEEGEWRKFK